MIIFDDIFGGFITLFSDQYAIWFVILAAFVGIVFGALPGLTAAAAIAMMLPVLIAYNDEIGGLAGLAFLYVIGKSGRYGGSIAAILFNTPGTAASAATMQDGYPMTQSGRAGKALKTATVASAYGDYFGEMVLIFGAVAIAAFTRQFGPPENFAIYLMAFVVIGSVVSDSIIKGIISTLFGAVIALIGEDVITGQFKMTMGIDELESGMALVPLLIGVFVISEVIIQAGGQFDIGADAVGKGRAGGGGFVQPLVGGAVREQGYPVPRAQHPVGENQAGGTGTYNGDMLVAHGLFLQASVYLPSMVHSEADRKNKRGANELLLDPG